MSEGRGGVGWTKQATARDVAAVAGVSAQTVSRVANGAANVAPETRERVLAAMRRVGYTPNAAARALRSGRSDVIGVVLHHLTRTGEAHIVEAVANTARDHGYSVLLVDAGSGAAADLDRALTGLGPDLAGVAVLGLETADVERLHVPARLPVVVVDSRPLPHPTVGFDQRGGAHLAVTHLLGLGHHTVHHVAGPARSLQAGQRRQAWQAALEAAGRPVPPVLQGDWTPESGYRAGLELAADPDVTAVFVANDEMATGLLHALHESGRRVPQDISVVGFDDVAAAHLWPPLTTVHQDFAEVGARLVRMLLRALDPAHAADPADAGLVEARLVVRASTAPPAGQTTR